MLVDVAIDQGGCFETSRADDALRADLRGRRHRPLLRREHARRRADHARRGRSRTRRCRTSRRSPTAASPARVRTRPRARARRQRDGGQVTYEPVARDLGHPVHPALGDRGRRAGLDRRQRHNTADCVMRRLLVAARRHVLVRHAARRARGARRRRADGDARDPRQVDRRRRGHDRHRRRRARARATAISVRDQLLQRRAGSSASRPARASARHAAPSSLTSKRTGTVAASRRCPAGRSASTARCASRAPRPYSVTGGTGTLRPRHAARRRRLGESPLNTYRLTLRSAERAARPVVAPAASSTAQVSSSSMRWLPSVFGLTRSRSRNSATPSSNELRSSA